MADLVNPYFEMTTLQSKLREVVLTSELRVELEPEPGEPASLDDLTLTLAALRTNMALTERALNEADRQRNGPELRTREEIKADIKADMELLESPIPDDSPRTREEIEANIRYDELQLARTYFPGCE